MHGAWAQESLQSQWDTSDRVSFVEERAMLWSTFPLADVQSVKAPAEVINRIHVSHARVQDGLDIKLATSQRLKTLDLWSSGNVDNVCIATCERRLVCAK